MKKINLFQIDEPENCKPENERSDLRKTTTNGG